MARVRSALTTAAALGVGAGILTAIYSCGDGVILLKHLLAG